MNEIEQLRKEIQELRDYIYQGELTDRTIFDKPINPSKGIILSGGAVITGGNATTNASIKLEVGTLPKGSIYISSNGVGEIWVMQTSTWVLVTIP